MTGIEPWWPHTHGSQPLYDVLLVVGNERVRLGRVGFRALAVEDQDGEFKISINDVPIFCRGACWLPIDPVSLNSSRAMTRRALTELRDAGCNMVRVTGTMVYEEDHFYEACDELGLLVWQDCMLANADPPTNEEFEAALQAELQAFAKRVTGRPCLVVVSGGSEIEQQAAMSGAERDRWYCEVIEERVASHVARYLSGVHYVSSTPSRGPLPFVNDEGVAHYFGVGAYRRPLEDARRAGVRFAAECLAFAVPPDRQTIEEHFGSVSVVGHDPSWKVTVPRDIGAAWDFEDVTAHYVATLFDVEPTGLRSFDPERSLELSSAAVVRCFETVISEWRRVGSSCNGALVLSARDVFAGPGWGLIDAEGRRKSSWYAMSHVCAPQTVLITDEGLNGLHLHVINEGPQRCQLTVVIELLRSSELLVERGEVAVELGPHDSKRVNAYEAFDYFVDVNYAYRFGPPGHDTVVVTLVDESGVCLVTKVHPLEEFVATNRHDVGLEAKTSRGSDTDCVQVEISTAHVAQFVTIDAPGYTVEDQWFHLSPGHPRTIRLYGGAKGASRVGQVRALNSSTVAVLELA
jgi:beta-mannosidase